MNLVLEEILRTGMVRRGDEEIPLHSEMARGGGELLRKAFLAANPTRSLEVGFAYGFSTLYACDALAQANPNAKHTILDPVQSTFWEGIGTDNIRRAGYGHMIELLEEYSEVGLPKLLASGARFQAAIIDGWHTFDHALVDFFFVNKMLDVGGIVVLDDMDFAGLTRLYDHILTYPCYELFDAFQPEPPTPRGIMGTARTVVRRSLAVTLKARRLRRPWDYPRCAAFRKIAEDDRSWDWHADF